MTIIGKLASFVFRKAAHTSGLSRRLWGILRKVLIVVLKDPTCVMTIHGRPMYINMAHELPLYISRFPLYDSVLARLGTFVWKRRQRLRVIDVGANIGDSIAAFLCDSEGDFLVVEPTPKFQALLRANWGHSSRVQVVNAMCSSSDRVTGISIDEHGGTAVLMESHVGHQVPVCTVDRLAREHGFSSVDVIKIDTDGFDFDVIAGAVKTIHADHPAVVFECDIFSRSNYVEQVWQTLAVFRAHGYRHVLVYDNVGYLIARLALTDASCLNSLLFYQLTGPLPYFDMLLLSEPDAHEFFSQELDWFARLAHGVSHEATRTLATALKNRGRDACATNAESPN